MPENKPLTGYPSIDKPWLKYYTQEQINADLPKNKIYDYVWQNNKDYQARIALNYYDHRITYGQMFKGIEKAAKAYKKIGVCAGDVVSILAVTLCLRRSKKVTGPPVAGNGTATDGKSNRQKREIWERR